MTRGSNTRQVAHHHTTRQHAFTSVMAPSWSVLSPSKRRRRRTLWTNKRKYRDENVSQALVIFFIFMLVLSTYLLSNYLQFDYMYRTKITTTKLVIHTITITKAAAGGATRPSPWYVFHIFNSLESLGVITEEIWVSRFFSNLFFFERFEILIIANNLERP